MATRNSDPDEIGKKAQVLRGALERRYPDLFISVEFVEHPGVNTYKGWRVSFESCDPCVLIQYGLASSLSDFDSDGGITEWAGYRWHAHGVIDASKRYAIGFHVEEDRGSDRRDPALTKKTQTQVLRLLKPFIKGTWKDTANKQGGSNAHSHSQDR